MSYRKRLTRSRCTLACIGLLCAAGVAVIAVPAEGPALTPPASAPQARIALASNPLRRCPALRTASEDDRDVAVVTFLVGPSGVPSHPSLVAPSGSQELDAAAMSCVLRLRFQPATRLGDGTAIESWQQTRWKWAPAEHPTGASAAPQSAPSAAPVSAQGGGSSAPPAASASASPTGNRAEVRVCVDANGKLTGEPRLTRASGDTEFDAAAIEVAKSGSGLYRAGTTDGKLTAGCLQLAIAPSGR
jgi:TonB family protein